MSPRFGSANTGMAGDVVACGHVGGCGYGKAVDWWLPVES